MDVERERLAAADEGSEPWRAWGPYVSERAWGTVREDYSPTGEAWDFFPHDHARSRAYRWSEDGLAGVCDAHETWCLALALWNGVDPILKERPYGLTGGEGNHGEDVKDYWWYLDSTPTHSWMRWRYHYPQREFPYADLAATNKSRGKNEPEYELVDTGVFADDRYWAVTVDYAKASPEDLLMRVTVENRGPEQAQIEVLPTFWFRNTWSWGSAGKQTPPTMRVENGSIAAEHHSLGRLTLSGDFDPELLFCDNETNSERLWGAPGGPAYPKDGINDHVVGGSDTVNPDRVGTKAALRYRLTVAPGKSATIRVRLTASEAPGDVDAGFDKVMKQRLAEADAFFESLNDPDLTADQRLVLRRAVAGMLWSKQFYRYDVDRWLVGDPAGPQPPGARLEGRNTGWRHLDSRDVISMPDKWEYPWFAAWDLAFHCIALAWVDAKFAKEQLLLLCREWYMHPNGQLPAYEWAFGDVNPPVQAWAALHVFHIDGSKDFEFLERMFHKLSLNFTWWVNRKDAEGNNVFEGGFLGLDNIGPIDRSAELPMRGHLEQSDGTAWMAKFSLNLLEMALVLAQHDTAYEEMTTKYLEHFLYISAAMFDNGLWDDQDGFFYDVLVGDDGRRIPLRVRSMVGLLPLCASAILEDATLEALPEFTKRMEWFCNHRPHYARGLTGAHRVDHHDDLLLSIVKPEQLEPLLKRMLDETEFLSAHGLRAMSARHRDEPFVLDVDGTTFSVDYEPGESVSGMFGGNSNWRGPVWMPVNYLVIGSLRRLADFYGDGFTVEYPTGSGQKLTLHDVADDLANRLISLFTLDASGRRPFLGQEELFQRSPAWRDQLWFHEYFHGDTGAGLGASHQTGWTGLVVDLLMRAGGRPDPA
ncbi:MAG: hypothetical protein QOJ03_2815 [Frankiaceae bacterium]|nr:hypothetical protein [Frankiaceae bacterium]